MLFFSALNQSSVVILTCPISQVRSLTKLGLKDVATRRDADTRLARYVTDPAMRAFALMNLMEHESGVAWRINLLAIEEQLGVLVS